MDHERSRFSFSIKLLLIFIVTAISSMAMGSLFLFAEFETMSPSENSGIFSAFSLVAILFLVASLLSIPFCLIGLLFKNTRKTSVTLIVIAFTAQYCLGCWIGWADDYRMAEFRKCAERSKPLVNAIFAYQKKYAKPPNELKALVPEFLGAVPGTGIHTYPEYEYLVGEKATIEYENPWALVVYTPENVLDFSEFYYVPNQYYPDHGHGGWIEKLGDWAYVHE